MASALDALLGSNGSSQASLSIVDFKPTLAKDSKGNHGFKLVPILSDGAEGRYGDFWIRLADGPAALRAFRAALPRIAKAIDALDDHMQKAGEWKAPEKPKATPSPAAKVEAAPKASALDSALSDLPF